MSQLRVENPLRLYHIRNHLGEWYGWFIDYWMEGGLMRDIYTHQLTTPEHWEMLVKYTFKYTKEMNWIMIHCEGSKVTDGCEPVAVISAEKLCDYTEGPPETAKIANVLLNDDRTGQYVIAQEAWDYMGRTNQEWEGTQDSFGQAWIQQ